MTTPQKPKPFSMIREFHLADWFTLGNAISGIGALFSIMTYLQTGDIRHIYFACALLVAALAFDVFDGRIARWRQQTSAIGRELDSLADIISFGVAPAVMGYALGMNGLYDRIALAYFVACGVSRLARYNVTAEELSGGGDKGGCKNFCVNGYLAGNCRAPRSEDDRSKESRTERVAGQPAG